ncbi:MAG: hypothetical protein PsegKO_22070 [Pseudohongiellaceae bacterium]
MLIFGTQEETLPVSLKSDATTGLPLLSEQGAVLQYLLAYLALPYSVTGYGCGKKASVIIDQLLALGVPSYAISRLLILEADMSPAALARTDSEDRDHALVADNLLANLVDTSDPRLRSMLNDFFPEAKLLDDASVKVGPYKLHGKPKVQFVATRSHVSPTLTFWDAKNSRPVELVIDPSLVPDRLFPPQEMRGILDAPQALLFSAPLLARFRLESNYLTAAQRDKLAAEGGLASLDFSAEAQWVRRHTGAQKGSIGDPETWTYANNLDTADDEAATDHDHFKYQELITGQGDGLRAARARLLQARQAHHEQTSEILEQMRNIEQESNLLQRCLTDAEWSRKCLQPLADAATVFVYFNSLLALVRTTSDGDFDAEEILTDADKLQNLRGLGVRLRRRIDWLANTSMSDDGILDGRALGEGFIAATIETIRQMNLAGLAVFMDKVGNVHGLLVNDEQHSALQSGKLSPAQLCRQSIWHGSHIDTVNDAGKFDGRLGVLGGLETLNIVSDLARYFDLSTQSATNNISHVSAFIGEEMTFTGEKVSMPGSAAVCSRAEVSRIHRMHNAAGEQFGERLLIMLERIATEQQAGTIELNNKLAGRSGEDLLNACSEPAEFFSTHSFERHIEQGPILDRADVPLVMVGTIMGIHQEDFTFQGAHAEWAALELTRRLREIVLEPQFMEVRITVGMLAGEGEAEVRESIWPASRWTLAGQMNHAGATPTPDRCDPGVAAGRLAREFRRWYQQSFAPAEQQQIVPLVSSVRLLPGTNRNVIPKSVSMTLALQDQSTGEAMQLDDLLAEDMEKTLESFIIGTLSRQVAGGGEGVQLSRIEPISFTRVFPNARLSIDLRAASETTMADFRSRIGDVIAEIEQEFTVQCQGDLQQLLAPSNLQQSGQALLMERSYGGSHNPRETELLSDIVRGSVLQLAVTRDFLCQDFTNDDCEDLNLFDFTEQRMPRVWLEKMSRFTSGALHDTCNIAARSGELGSSGSH